MQTQRQKESAVFILVKESKGATEGNAIFGAIFVSFFAFVKAA